MDHVKFAIHGVTHNALKSFVRICTCSVSLVLSKGQDSTIGTISKYGDNLIDGWDIAHGHYEERYNIHIVRGYNQSTFATRSDDIYNLPLRSRSSVITTLLSPVESLYQKQTPSVSLDPPKTGMVRINVAVELMIDTSFKFPSSPTTKLLQVRGSNVPPENSGFLPRSGFSNSLNT